jgi:hypothetical protein
MRPQTKEVFGTEVEAISASLAEPSNSRRCMKCPVSLQDFLYTKAPLLTWLRCYNTSRKITGSIPDEIIGFFNLPNPHSSTRFLGLLSI